MLDNNKERKSSTGEKEHLYMYKKESSLSLSLLVLRLDHFGDVGI